MTQLRKTPTKSRTPLALEGSVLREKKHLLFDDSRKQARFAETLLIADEDPEEIIGLRNRLETEFRPLGILENEFVDEIAACLWRLRRMRSIEAGIIARGISLGPRAVTDPLVRRRYFKELDSLKEWEPIARNEGCVLGVAFDRSRETMAKMMTHEASIERSLYRALRTLQRIQEARGE